MRGDVYLPPLVPVRPVVPAADLQKNNVDCVLAKTAPERIREGSREVPERFPKGFRKASERFPDGSRKVSERSPKDSRKMPERFQTPRSLSGKEQMLQIRSFQYCALSRKVSGVRNRSGTFRKPFGNLSGTVRKTFGNLSGTFRDPPKPFGSPPETFREPSGNLSVTFREPFGTPRKLSGRPRNLSEPLPKLLGAVLKPFG